MNEQKTKRSVRIIVNSLATIFVIGVFSIPALMGGLKDPGNPLSHKQVKKLDSLMTKVLTMDDSPSSQSFTMDELLSNIKNFVDTPEGGTSWKVFGETIQNPYSYQDEEGLEWSGVRPEFSEGLKKLDGTEILIQGYMFPLGQEEKQPLFLLGPYPVSCPYHYHVTPNLIIEVHAKTSVAFSYDPVNIKGTLELVPEDDEYNVFYRLNDSEFVP